MVVRGAPGGLGAANGSHAESVVGGSRGRDFCGLLPVAARSLCSGAPGRLRVPCSGYASPMSEKRTVPLMSAVGSVQPV